MRSTFGMIIFAVVMLIIASIYIRSNNETRLPVPEQSIRCTTEPVEPIEEETRAAEPVVIMAHAKQQSLCPTPREQAVLRLRSLYRAHLTEVRCG